VGSPPTTASVPIGTAAGLVELADTADARTAWNTAAWPLVADTPTLPEVEA
jgi:hypothetical protein